MKARSEELLVQFGTTFGTMAVRLWMPGISRGSVFCIHGFEGNGGDFDYLANRLVQHDLTVICPDMIGRGKSTFFGDASSYDLRAYVNCIAALSKYAGKKNHFLGTSWGGAIAMSFLHGAGMAIDKLILNDVSLRGGPAVDRLMSRIRQEASLEFDRIDDAYAYLRHTRAFLGEFAEELWPDYLQNRIRSVNGKYRLAYDPAAVPAGRQEPFDCVPVLEKIKADIMLLYGERSEFFNAEAVAEIQARRAGISCISVPGAGHPPSLMTPEQSLLVSDFLCN